MNRRRMASLAVCMALLFLAAPLVAGAPDNGGGNSNNGGAGNSNEGNAAGHNKEASPRPEEPGAASQSGPEAAGGHPSRAQGNQGSHEPKASNAPTTPSSEDALAAEDQIRPPPEERRSSQDVGRTAEASDVATAPPGGAVADEKAPPAVGKRGHGSDATGPVAQGGPVTERGPRGANSGEEPERTDALPPGQAKKGSANAQAVPVSPLLLDADSDGNLKAPQDASHPTRQMGLESEREPLEGSISTPIKATAIVDNTKWATATEGTIWAWLLTLLAAPSTGVGFFAATVAHRRVVAANHRRRILETPLFLLASEERGFSRMDGTEADIDQDVLLQLSNSGIDSLGDLLAIDPEALAFWSDHSPDQIRACQTFAMQVAGFKPDDPPEEWESLPPRTTRSLIEALANARVPKPDGGSQKTTVVSPFATR